MIIVVALVGIVAGVVVLARRRARSTQAPPSDGPARLAAAAGRLLPASRREWGQAMAAELSAIDGPARRWRFAAGVAAVALVPPGHRVRALSVAVVTAAATVAVAWTADRTLPQLSVFASVLGALLTVVLAAIALRWRRPGPAAAITAALVVAGSVATVASVVAVTRDHPSAVSDPSHVYGVVFAVVLAIYVVLAAASAGARRAALWWGLGGAVASSLVWLSMLPSHATIEGLGLYLWPVGGAGALVASVGAARTRRSVTAGARAALTAAIVSAPVFFALDLVRVLTLDQYVLTSPYDLAQYPHSGFPDVASFVLSDTIGGGIIGVLMMYPVLLVAVGLLGGVIGAAGPFRRPVRSSPGTHS
jgi:hypothetical protein